MGLVSISPRCLPYRLPERLEVPPCLLCWILFPGPKSCHRRAGRISPCAESGTITTLRSGWPLFW